MQSAPLVSDPFSASKRVKKQVNSEENSKDVDKSVKKVLDYEEEPGATLDSSKENAEETGTADKSAKKKKLPQKGEEQQKPVVDLKYNSEDFKEASNGKEWNFKIASWNINGVRAWIEVSLSLSGVDSSAEELLNCMLSLCVLERRLGLFAGGGSGHLLSAGAQVREGQDSG